MPKKYQRNNKKPKTIPAEYKEISQKYEMNIICPENNRGITRKYQQTNKIAQQNQQNNAYSWHDQQNQAMLVGSPAKKLNV